MVYQRQKVLLALLRRTPDRRAFKTQLIKWLFLLREEENLDKYVSFYNFFPYKYGPFSFLANKDISELERFGCIKSDSDFLQYTALEKDSAYFDLPSNIMLCIERVFRNYGKLSTTDLINYIYESYPWYASRSKIRQLDLLRNSSKPKLAIYSLGYECLTIDGFLDEVLKAGIKVVIDSRNNPISRKYGFSKSFLASRCSDVGINYYQFSEIGIPSEFRNQADNKQDLWNFYLKEILPRNSKSLKLIGDICKSNPSVLICFEKDPNNCHRHILAKELSLMTNLPIIHFMEGRWNDLGRESKNSYNCQDLSYTI